MPIQLGIGDVDRALLQTKDFVSFARFFDPKRFSKREERGPSRINLLTASVYKNAGW
jgi:hypothetical protein